MLRWVLAIALVVSKGGTLYVIHGGTQLLEKPGGKTLSTLSAGQKVTWQGADKRDKRYQQINTSDGKSGVVLQTELSPNAPVQELGAGPISDDPPMRFPGHERALAELRLLERIARGAAK